MFCTYTVDGRPARVVVAHLLEVDGADGVVRLLIPPQAPRLLLQTETTPLTTTLTVTLFTGMSTGVSTGGPQSRVGGHRVLIATSRTPVHLAPTGRAGRLQAVTVGAETDRIRPFRRVSSGPAVRGPGPRRSAAAASAAHSRHMRRRGLLGYFSRATAICAAGTVL